MSQTKAQLLGPVLGDVNYDSGTLFVDSVNNRVGIGTDVPSGILHCVGLKDSSNFIFSAPLTTVGGTPYQNYSELLFKNSLSNNTSDASIRYHANIWDSSGSQLRLLTSNTSGTLTTAITINAQQNVGIGTTNPSVKLDVNGAIVSSDSVSVTKNSSFYVPLSVSESGAATDEKTWRIGILDRTNKAFYIATLNDASNTSWSALTITRTGVQVNYVALSTANGQERLRITSGGNVGIGTTNPQYALHSFSSTSNAAALLESTQSGSDNVQLRFKGTSGERWAIGNNVATGGTGLNFDIFDLVASENRLRIDSSGNVGIGTNPSYKLDVWGGGSSRIASRLKSVTGDTLILSTTDASNRMELLFSHLTNSYWRIQSVEQSTGYRPLVLNNEGGNVGIATTNPGYRLHVNGEAKVGPELLVNNGAYGSVGNRIVVGSDTLPYSLQDTNIRPTIYLSGAYPEVTLNHTTTTNERHGPTLKFVHNGTGTQFVIGTNGTGTQLDIGYSSAGDWNAHNGIDNYQGTTRFRLAASGVQIGSISGTAEGSLDVVGSHINGTAAASWSGYTLGDTYCDLTISRRHSATIDTVLGYAAASMDFRASNSADEWSVGQIIGLVDPLSDGGHKGGLAFAVATGGQTNATGRRTKGYATIRAILNGTQMRMVQDTRTVYGPNSTWGAYLSVGGNGDNSAAGVASMSTTNGNLHLDSADGASVGVYLNWYGGGNGIYVGNGASVQVARVDGSGNFTASGTKSFKIPHPLPEKTETHDLIHVAVESPQAENIYSGMIKLISGVATVNLDDVSGMTEGTFVLLNTKLRRFVTNESGWTPVKSSISGNILTIEAQDTTCEDECFWMVIGQRSDIHMIDSDMTDETGNMIVEPLKEIYNSSQVN